MHKQQLKNKRQSKTQQATSINTIKRRPSLNKKKAKKPISTSTRTIAAFASTSIPQQQQPTIKQSKTSNTSTLKLSRFKTQSSQSVPLRSHIRLFSTDVTTNEAPQITPPDMTQEFYKLDLRVALLQNIRHHPGADSLYLIDCHVGEEVPRQLVSNVKPYMSIPKLTNRQQIVLANLKPVSFRGEKSFAMMLGSSQRLAEGETPPPPTPDGQNGLAEPLYTPTNTQVYISEGEALPPNTVQFKPGQRLYLAGQSPVVGEIARVNDKGVAKLLGELGTDTEGNLHYLGKSVVFGPVDTPVKVNLGIPDAKLY